MKSIADEARKFLSEASQFQLGVLPTESRHPRTTKLSQLAKDDLPQALRLFAEVDRQAVGAVRALRASIEDMGREIRNVLATGGRIFLCGCGATGRLSISLETLWREEVARQGKPELGDRVFSFIAGGDFALVRSIENFEDHPEFGVRQLQDLGFSEKDLLISCTEGGETPFVIGATEEAARVAKRQPYFLYCNPTDLLKKTAERSRKIIDHPRVRPLSVSTGPMALSGSTRLQATTVLMLATGAAMFSAIHPQGAAGEWIDEFAQVLESTHWTALEPLIRRESEIYAAKGYCVHRTSRYGITVLTDTTERTPTFSLLPFESPTGEEREPSWTYLCLPEARTSLEAWRMVLGRDPRSLTWPEYTERFGLERTLGYDFSPASLERRRKHLGPNQVYVFDIQDRGEDIAFMLDGVETRLRRPKSLLAQHLLVKCALNMISTLVMGRLGRFHGNVMVFVRPTNKKLIDRSIRYIRLLLEDEGLSPLSYDEVCLALFEEFAGSRADEPVVVKTFERLKRAQQEK